MPLVYVTGISGAGKSAVLQELRRRGHVAFGVDEDGYGRWLDRCTGQPKTYPIENKTLDPHEWYAKHDWVLDAEKIAELKSVSIARPISCSCAGWPLETPTRGDTSTSSAPS